MLKRSFFGVFFLGVVLLFGCSTIDNRKLSKKNDSLQPVRELAGGKAASVIGPNGQVILFYRDGGKIVVKECMEETILKDSSYKRDCLQGEGAKTREIPVEEFKEDLKRALQIPHSVSKANYDGKTKARIELYKKGMSKEITDLKHQKNMIREAVGTTTTFNGLYGAGNNLRNTGKQGARNARLAEIEARLNTKNIESAIAEINGLIDTIVDEVMSQGELRHFVFSENQTGFEFNLLRSYFRTSDDLQAYFVPIKAGLFLMGSPKDEYARYDDEILHGVILTKGFEMQTTEVTQRQWFHVMGDNPSYFKPSQSRRYCRETAIIKETYTMCPDHPVENVSWQDVQRFIKKLNRSSQVYVYRLPTEAEWEYAAREGGKSTTPFNLGENISTDKVNYDGDEPYGRSAAKGIYRAQTVAVGSLDNANALGISDMHGNVWEWVQDLRGDYPGSDSIDPRSFIRDPKGPSSGRDAIIRGGSWYTYARSARSAFRDTLRRAGSSNTVGFRLVRTAK